MTYKYLIYPCYSAIIYEQKYSSHIRKTSRISSINAGNFLTKYDIKIQKEIGNGS